ncbi:MAG: hypothetical protein M3082_04200 [Candidatus Dormibacteraeota bacterium]|nr:hypothetical protein [Candidatus Dormibacteraeota bacterium]
MSSSFLFRLAGWSLGVGSVVYIVLTLGGDVALGQGPQHFTSPLYTPISALQAIAGIAIVLGLTGHYARQHAPAGKLGLIGFVPLVVSIALYAFALPLMSAILFSWLAGQPATRHALEGNNGPSGLVVFFVTSTVLNLVGLICYGIATWRASIFGKWAAGVLLAGGLFAVIGFVVGSSSPNLPAWVSDLPGQIFIAALAWLGFRLATEHSRIAELAIET